MSEATLMCPWCGHPQSEHPTVGGCSHRWTEEICMCRKTLLEVTQAIELERERQMLDKALADLEKATNELETLKNPKPCTWMRDNIDGSWMTACGNEFVLETGTPTENGMEFCCYCGLPMADYTLLEIGYVEQEDEQ